MEYTLMPLTIFLNGIKDKETGIYYIDSKPREVCHIGEHKKAGGVFIFFS
jgi:hypothetical protein